MPEIQRSFGPSSICPRCAGWLRTLLKWIGKPELDTYFHQHYATVEMGLAAWDQGQRDLLFHGASAVIVVAADNDASCSAEDALLATGNMLLAAHALGLGACWFTLFDKGRMREILEVPAEKTPLALVCLGKPAAEAAPVPRKKVMERVVYFKD